MADPVVEIEVQLRRSHTLETAADYRKSINERFAALSPDEAAELLEKILTFNGSRLPIDFRVLSRHVRVELLLKLVMRLGTQTRKAFYARLVGHAGQPGDPRLQKGLRLAFPSGTEALRAKFLKGFRTPISAHNPMVVLEFRNIGPLSPDNQCPGRSTIPETLGFDPDPARGYNWMEIRGMVRGHRPGAEYRFRRTIEFGTWYLALNKWKRLEYLYPGSEDDIHDSDEDRNPDNDHIYVVDGPGSPIPPTLDDVPRAETPYVTEYVYMMNAVEIVDVKVDSHLWTPTDQLAWFSVTWLEKVGSKWRRKPGKNAIEKGAISDMLHAATVGEPPQSF